MKRTQIVCLHEGEKDSIDPIFVNAFLKKLNPTWLRPWAKSKVKLIPCTDKTTMLKHYFPVELERCTKMGADTTLVVMTDLDDDCANGDILRDKYRQIAENAEIDEKLFAKVVFICPKYRIENWIEYLNTGHTDENIKAPRTDNNSAKMAAIKLADMCQKNVDKNIGNADFPLSLKWSCNNWNEISRQLQK
ncbi:MAG: hypothetical protein FWG68_07680 [Defluviitaleaceae bacterium]|nr:hypothetical protein [Defluviitaleaceae bacterium]